MNYILRSIRITCMVSGIIVYMLIAKEIYLMLQPSGVKSMTNQNRRRLVTMTITFTLITTNNVIFFIIPDAISFFFLSGNYIIYLMNCIKGLANIIIFLCTQKELRREILLICDKKKAQMSWKTNTLKLFTYKRKETSAITFHKKCLISMSSSTPAMPVPRDDNVFMYVYIVEGGIIVTVNLFLIVFIYWNNRLCHQKEYVLFAATMIGDWLFGITYLLSGIRRLSIYGGAADYLEAYSRWDCFNVHHAFIFVTSTPLVGIISLLTCIDRLIAVTYPTKYYTFTSRYAFAVTVLAFLLTVPTTVISGIKSYNVRNIHDVTSICIMNQAITIDMSYVLRGIRITCMVAGACIYVFVAKRIYSMSKQNGSKTTIHSRRRLFTMTTTFTLITLNNVVCFVLPDIASFFFISGNYAVYVMNCTKGVANIIIFVYTQKDLRREILQICFKRKARHAKHTLHWPLAMLNRTSDRPIPHKNGIYMWIYVFDGSIIFVVNIFIVFVIYLNRQLRRQKEYILFAANMLSDGIFGLNYLTSGMRRLMILYSEDQYLELYSRWECFLVYHSILFVISTPLVGILSLFTSLDRFFAVTFPARYYSWSNQYAFLLTFLAFLLSIPTLIAAGIGSYQHRDVYDVTSLCILNDSITPSMTYIIRVIRIGCAMTSLLLYVIIAKKVYKILQPQNTNTSIKTAQNRRRLKAMTITFSLITANDIVFFVIPDSISFFYSQGNYLLYTLNCTKGIVNIFIFLYTQRELRRELLEVFCQNKKQVIHPFHTNERQGIIHVS
uniref:G_PROTEIN_RECEP_F1_2 domain-containing protein n=1 Tax=Panagrellus redivivus TaxID=6233 RepID=A0A7E4VBN7_PANRE